MPPDAATYPKLKKIGMELNKQNEIIFEAEHERALLEIEREYQDKVAEWEEAYGEKTFSKEETIKERIQRHQKELAEQRTDRGYDSKGKGAR